jgi:hypothetical protein
MLIAYKVLAASVVIAVAAGPPEAKFQVLGAMTGADSQIESPGFKLVSSEDSWKALWTIHRSQFNIQPNLSSGSELDAAPDVNFKKNMVLAAFAGQQSGVAGYEVSSVSTDKSTVQIHVKADYLPNSGVSVVGNPYIFVMMTRTKKPVELYLDGDSGSRRITSQQLPKEKSKAAG